MNVDDLSLNRSKNDDTSYFFSLDTISPLLLGCKYFPNDILLVTWSIPEILVTNYYIMSPKLVDPLSINH